MTDRMTDIAALLVAVALLIAGAVLFFGPQAEDFERVCAEHGGVAQINAPIPSGAFAVCKDGRVFKVKA